MTNLPIVALDFEASCLPTPLGESYPIEIGVAFVATGEIRSWLIRPTYAWRRDGYWDPKSEALHGISLEQLEHDGRDVAIVRRELSEAVTGHIAVSDNERYESFWLKMLYDGDTPFEIHYFEAALFDQVGLPPIAFRDALRDAEEAALVSVPQRHRAAPDARRLAETCRLMLRCSREPHRGSG